jgi:hypothetical protein
VDFHFTAAKRIEQWRNGIFEQKFDITKLAIPHVRSARDLCSAIDSQSLWQIDRTLQKPSQPLILFSTFTEKRLEVSRNENANEIIKLFHPLKLIENPVHDLLFIQVELQAVDLLKVSLLREAPFLEALQDFSVLRNANWVPTRRIPGIGNCREPSHRQSKTMLSQNWMWHELPR